MSALRLPWLLLCLMLALPAIAQPRTAPKPATPSRSSAATLDPGSLEGGTYRNSFFGFACKIPYGWVLRTKEMASADEKNQGAILLAAFARPPEANEKGVNATMLVAAEPMANYPGLTQAVDYFDPLTEVVKSKGFTIVNPPYAFPVGAHPLVRSDFRKQSATIAAYQSSLVMLSRGYIVSFTFITESEDDADELVENLSFIPARQAPPAK
jgi:hypothetical protein